MKTLLTRAERLTNICLVVAALVLGGALVKRQLRPASRTADDGRTLVGKKLALPGGALTAGGRTLLLVLSMNCPQCTRSAPFYGRLTREHVREGCNRSVAVLPQEAGEGRRYLSEHGVVVDEVVQASPLSVGAPGTPTLMLLDGAGVVTGAWVGELSPEEESEVLARLQ